MIALKFNLMVNYQTELKAHYERTLKDTINDDTNRKIAFRYRFKNNDF
jgi:hypothetical protein